MKKFDIKMLLILVLVLVMAFSLVACDKGGGEEVPVDEEPVEEGYTAAAYFGDLWTAASSIGATKFAATDTIGLSLELGVSIAVKDVEPVQLGIAIDAILDQAAIHATEASLGKSAAKIQIYMDKATKANLLTLYYFFDDANNVYIDWGTGEKLKVAFDAYWNEKFATMLGGLLNQNILGENSVSDIIDLVVTNGGDDWTLDKLLLGNATTPGLLSLFGLDLGELLKTVGGLLSIDFGDGEVTSLLPLLQNKALGKLLFGTSPAKSAADADGWVTYTASVPKSTVSLLKSMLDGILDGAKLTLSFKAKDGVIDGFNINAVLSAAGVGKETTLDVAIKNLEFKKVDAAKAAETFGCTKSAYKSYVDFDIALGITSDGLIAINPTQNAHSDNAINFTANGTYTLQLKGTLDLVGAANANATVAQLNLKKGANDIISASYKSNTLKVLLANTPETAALMEGGLYDLLDIIEDAAANGEINYDVFVKMAQNLRNKAFDANGDYNTAFTSFEMTGIDIAALARGAFYGIFVSKDIVVEDEMVAYEGDADGYYTLGGKLYKDAQYAHSLNVKNIISLVTKNISYADGVYTIATPGTVKEFLFGLYKAGELQAYKYNATSKEYEEDGDAAAVALAANDSEKFALIFCTNNNIVKQFTDAGYLPLYKEGVTDKYLTTTYTAADAFADGYYYQSGKMINKATAIAMWTFINSADSVTTFNSKAYVAHDGFATAAEFKADVLPNWLCKFFDGSSFDGATNAATLDNLFKSGLSIKVNTVDTGLGGAAQNVIEIAATNAGKTLTVGADINFKATDAAMAVVEPTLGTDAALVSVDLGASTGTIEEISNFYKAFYAQCGGNKAGTIGGENTKTETFYYYVAASATGALNADGEYVYSAIGDLSHVAVVIADDEATTDKIEAIAFDNTVGEANGIIVAFNADKTEMTVGEGGESMTFTIYGQYNKVLVEKE